MFTIFVTDDVSKPLTSTEVRLEQPLKMDDIFVTDEVSNDVTSRVVKLEQS